MNKILMVLLVLATSSQAQISAEFNSNGKLYQRINNQWMVTETMAQQPVTFQVNTHEITVKLAARSDRASFNQLLSAKQWSVNREASTGFIDINVTASGDFQAAYFALENSGLFAVVEANTYGQYGLVPNDAQYGSQWNMPIVQAEDAWDRNTGSASVVVAVLDSGTEFNHDDLGMGTDGYENIWLNPGEDAWSDPTDPSTGNGIDDDNNGYVDDWKGYNFDQNTNNGSGAFFHGTAVAGVVAAKTNNGTGVAGLAGGNNSPGVSIMIGNVGNTAPNGAVLDDAIIYAAENGADIVQLSLTVGTSAALEAAIDLAYNTHGLLVICSSGNSGGGSVGYPSSLPLVMSIGSTDQTDSRSSFSQFGPNVEIAAPGSSIRTTDLNDGYLTTSGTSFSSPLVSGLAGLILSHQPGLTNVQLRDILNQTADKVGGYDYNHDAGMPGRSLELGYGRINAEAALIMAESLGVGSGLIFANGFESDVIFANGFE
jgi:subtilisin family serine protease